MEAKRSWVALAVGLVVLTVPASASGALTIGANPLPPRTSVITSGGARIFTNDVVPGVELASPIDGVVVRWRVRRGSGPGVMIADTITLRVLRPTGQTNEFTAVGTSEPHMVPGGSNDPVNVYEYPTQLPIAAGDRVGLGTTVGEFTALSTAGASYLTRINALTDGQTATFAAGAFPNQQVLINADIEPDCDQDGFGDETQDPELTGPNCPPPTPPPTPQPEAGDSTAPEATITKRPKDKTTNRTATFEFTGTDARAISGFQCKFDGQPFAPCTSPYTLRVKKGRGVKKGRHTFQVQAIDQAGNVGSPATDTWKRKKKRRR
jgi:hypothetical protein